MIDVNGVKEEIQTVQKENETEKSTEKEVVEKLGLWLPKELMPMHSPRSTTTTTTTTSSTPNPTLQIEASSSPRTTASSLVLSGDR